MDVKGDNDGRRQKHAPLPVSSLLVSTRASLFPRVWLHLDRRVDDHASFGALLRSAWSRPRDERTPLLVVIPSLGLHFNMEFLRPRHRADPFVPMVSLNWVVQHQTKYQSRCSYVIQNAMHQPSTRAIRLSPMGTTLV